MIIYSYLDTKRNFLSTDKSKGLFYEQLLGAVGTIAFWHGNVLHRCLMCSSV